MLHRYMGMAPEYLELTRTAGFRAKLKSNMELSGFLILASIVVISPKISRLVGFNMVCL